MLIFSYFVKCDYCGYQKEYDFDNQERTISDFIKGKWIFKPYLDKENIHFCSTQCKLNYEKELKNVF